MLLKLTFDLKKSLIDKMIKNIMQLFIKKSLNLKKI